MTIISVLPIGLGSFGLREVSSLIFNKIDSSLVLTSAVTYGLAVSGLLTFIGISYVNIRKIILNNGWNLDKNYAEVEIKKEVLGIDYGEEVMK